MITAYLVHKGLLKCIDDNSYLLRDEDDYLVLSEHERRLFGMFKDVQDVIATLDIVLDKGLEDADCTESDEDVEFYDDIDKGYLVYHGKRLFNVEVLYWGIITYMVVGDWRVYCLVVNQKIAWVFLDMNYNLIGTYSAFFEGVYNERVAKILLSFGNHINLDAEVLY